jgi:hypothetical protein
MGVEFLRVGNGFSSLLLWWMVHHYQLFIRGKRTTSAGMNRKPVGLGLGLGLGLVVLVVIVILVTFL